LALVEEISSACGFGFGFCVVLGDFYYDFGICGKTSEYTERRDEKR